MSDSKNKQSKLPYQPPVMLEYSLDDHNSFITGSNDYNPFYGEEEYFIDPRTGRPFASVKGMPNLAKRKR